MSKSLDSRFRGNDEKREIRIFYETIKLQFLEKVGRERLELFGTEDFLLLDIINKARLVPDHLRAGLHQLVAMGIIEGSGKGRGVRYNHKADCVKNR